MDTLITKCKVCGRPATYGNYCSKQCCGTDTQVKRASEQIEPDMPPLNGDNIATDGYVALVKAIVEQAKTDVVTQSPDSAFRIDAERFFQSSYFEVLTGLDGKTILHRLRREHIERKRRKEKRYGLE